MSILRRERRQFEPEPFVPPFPSTGLAYGAPSIDRALQVSAVWACVRLVADAVSMLPVGAFTMKGEVRVPVPSPAVLKQPSSDATMPEWLYMTLVSLMLRGNSYGRIVRRDALGFPSQIELLHPDTVQAKTDPQTGLFTYQVNNQTLQPVDVFHVRAFRMPGSRLGLSPIQYAARTINTEAAAADFGYDFFRNGAHPSSILSSDMNYTQAQAKEIKDRFMGAVQGREPAVLSGGMKYDQIQVKPEESQFLATQKYGVNQIARIFGVPPEMIGGDASNSMTYSNVEQRALDFLTYTIQPWLSRLEAAFAVLLPGQRHVRFDTASLVRTDFQTLMTGTAIGIASKQTTPDEARAMRDMPPLTQAQKDLLDLIPLEVQPTGKPKSVSLSAPPNVDFQNPADESPTGGK